MRRNTSRSDSAVTDGMEREYTFCTGANIGSRLFVLTRETTQYLELGEMRTSVIYICLIAALAASGTTVSVSAQALAPGGEGLIVAAPTGGGLQASAAAQPA